MLSPTAGAVVAVTLPTLGLPLAGVGLLAVDPVLDMARTPVNVAGQALVPTIVANQEGLLDQQQYDRGSTDSAVELLREPAATA